MAAQAEGLALPVVGFEAYVEGSLVAQLLASETYEICVTPMEVYNTKNIRYNSVTFFFIKRMT